MAEWMWPHISIEKGDVGVFVPFPVPNWIEPKYPEKPKNRQSFVHQGVVLMYFKKFDWVRLSKGVNKPPKTQRRLIRSGVRKVSNA